MFFYPTPCEDDQILVAAKTGDLKLLQKLRNEAGGNEAFCRKCEFVAELEGLICLHIAAVKGNVQLCRFLIEEVKIDVDFKSDTGETPLLFAAVEGQFKVVEYLISRGADVNIGGYQGATCLHIAAENGNKEMMQLLVLKGADIEAQSVRGTPLQCAASRGRVESVRFLLSRGADPNAFSRLSDSPLMGAILCRSYELLKLLLKAGADPNKLSCGLSPLAVAAKENDTQFLRSLLAARADPNSPTIELLLPIEYAADVHNAEGLTILFPVTKARSCYPDWSISGIENNFHSESAKAQRKESRDRFIRLLNEVGKNAVNRKDYSEALIRFSGAIYLQPNNAKFLSNRSICWAKLNEPDFALHDAEASIMLKPDWPKAHYRAGAAWMLLKNYTKACASFKKACMLDPGNMEIKKSLSLALKPAILGFAERDLLKTVTILALLVPFRATFYVDLRDMAEKDPSKAMRVLCEFLDSPSLLDNL